MSLIYRHFGSTPRKALMLTYNRRKDPSNCNKIHPHNAGTGPPDRGPEFSGAVWAEGVENGFREIYRPRPRFCAVRAIVGPAGRPPAIFHRTSSESAA